MTPAPSREGSGPSDKPHTLRKHIRNTSTTRIDASGKISQTTNFVPGNRTHLPQNKPNRFESARNRFAGKNSTHIACTKNIMEEKHNSQNQLVKFSKSLHNSDLGNRTYLPQNTSNSSESSRIGIAGHQSTHIACTPNITEEKYNSQNNLVDFSKSLHNSDLGNRTYLSQNTSNCSESTRNGIAGQQSTHIACTNIIMEEKNNSQNTNLLKFSNSLHF